MSEPQGQKFSLYSWLFKKLRKELIIWYFFTFFSSFFYYQAAHGLKVWTYENWKGYSSLFGTINIKSRGGLLLYLFFCFFIGNLLTSLVCDYWKNYTLALCRKQLRKLIVIQSAKYPQDAHLHRREILNNFLVETELFVPLFVLIPQRIYAAFVNIILTLIFVTKFGGSSSILFFALFFVAMASLAITFLSFFAYQAQKRINQKQNKFRQQENLAMEKYLEAQFNPQKVEKMVNSNFRKTHASLKVKSLSYLPNLVIPGLGILFCLVYTAKYGINWEIKEFAAVGIIALSLQTIFWKVREVVDNLLEISKIKVHYNSLQKTLSKLKTGQQI